MDSEHDQEDLEKIRKSKIFDLNQYATKLGYYGTDGNP